MSNTTRKTESRQLPAVSGSARLLQALGTVGKPENRIGEIEITSMTQRGPVTRRYFVQVHDNGYRLVGWNDKRKESTVYDIPATMDDCCCREFLSRSDRREDHSCKHCKAVRSLVEKGKLPSIEEDIIGDDEADTLGAQCGWTDAA